MKPVASLYVDLARDGDGWIAHDTRTGAMVRAATWAEALWAVRAAGAATHGLTAGKE